MTGGQRQRCMRSPICFHENLVRDRSDLFWSWDFNRSARPNCRAAVVTHQAKYKTMYRNVYRVYRMYLSFGHRVFCATHLLFISSSSPGLAVRARLSFISFFFLFSEICVFPYRSPSLHCFSLRRAPLSLRQHLLLLCSPSISSGGQLLAP